MFLFLEEPINSIGSVDYSTVNLPYLGKTKEGIGTGSSVNEVYTAYGEPEITNYRNST